MSHLEVISHSPEETRRFGAKLGRLAQPGDVFLLCGGLGVGKTCLVQGIARGLGIRDYVASPSFVLVRELSGRLPLYHIDFYRLDHLEEIAELGLDDYLYGKGVSAVEWAEKGLSLLPEEHLSIEIGFLSGKERRLKLKPHGQRYRQLISKLKK